VVALAGVFTGCGGSKYGSPKATFETMVAAAKAGDKDAMMACFDKETKGCFEELEKLAGKAKGPKAQGADVTGKYKDAEIEYGKEEIKGDTATLEVTTDGAKQTVKFKKEDGNWKISFPEMKAAVEMMKNMPKMMEGMMEGMGKAMKEGMKPEEAEAMKKSMEDALKGLEKK
jgi:hypothetical protein